MPMKKEDYPVNWKEISNRIKEMAGWKCERCGAVHNSLIYRGIKDPARFVALDNPDLDEIMYDHSDDYREKYVRVIITVHHIGVDKPDGTKGDPCDKMDCRDENLIAVCQRCHLLADQPHNIVARQKTFQRKRIARVLDAGQMVLFDE